VLGLEHDADAARAQAVVEPVGDLLGQALLHLQVACEQLDHARQLGEADDPVARQVADVRDAVEREHVVHAERVERDRARDDELVVAAVVGERRRRERRRRQQLGVGVGDPARRFAQSLLGQIGAEGAQQVGGRPPRGGAVDGRAATLLLRAGDEVDACVVGARVHGVLATGRPCFLLASGA
jgi:hypothetical protein